MTPDSALSLDVLIFGGGIAGLWLLDELRRRGYAAMLAENRALGQGQTIASQGIIHGGLKYMFDGNLTAPAKAISEMPPLWRACLAGEAEPNLSGTKVLSPGCHIWGTGSLKSRLFLKGSTIALRAAPVTVEKPDWPAVLANIPGRLLFVPEQVIDPVSLIGCLARRNAGHLIHTDATQPPVFQRSSDGQSAAVQLRLAGSGEILKIRPAAVVFTAGEGNESLRAAADLSAHAMQRRPLHMVMARGQLPELFGHVVGGSKPRLTVTTNTDSAGRRVWLMGGLVAENSVKMEAPELIAFARSEILACIPGLDLARVEFATYRIDRAEAATTSGQRPDDVHLMQEDNIITAWPTKLALAPRLTERILQLLPPPRKGREDKGWRIEDSAGAGASTIENRKSEIGNPEHPPQLQIANCKLQITPIAPPPWETAQWHTVS